MVPRAEIEAIDVEESVQELHRRFTETGLSKLLVHKDSIDNIIGYVHGYEMFRHPRSIRAVLRAVNFIPGTMPADEALKLFTKQRTHVAGILTIEDVVETIVGDIEDEHDEGEMVEERLSPNEFVFSARLEVAYLAETYGLAFDDAEEVDTLAGYILHHTGGLPEQGQVLEIGPLKLTVAQVHRGRIDLVNLAVVDPEQGFAK
jgi:CBS domain containing-hemolysin-like protein